MRSSKPVRFVIGDEEVALTGKYVIDRAAADLDHRRRCDAVARRHAAKIERFLDMLRITSEARDARCLFSGVRKHSTHLVRVETAERRARRCCAERVAE